MKQLPHVGTVELISLPSEGLHDVPAKVDTGADSSAIWASDISEKAGKLSYRLFGTGSPYYSGKLHTTSNYRAVYIKNSFGKTEYRYKVNIKLTLAGRTIRASVTLANRGSNEYPVLIGRRTMQGKFLVDTARRPAVRPVNKTGKPTPHPKNVLILSSKRTPITEKFAKSLEQYSANLQTTYAAYEDLQFTINNEKVKIVLTEGQRDLASFDMVHFKTVARHQEIAGAAAQYLAKRNVPFIDQAVQHYPATSKLYQYVILTDRGVSIPKSIYLSPARLSQSFPELKKQLGLPFILKDIYGSKGNHNYLVTDAKSFIKACKQADAQSVRLIAQKFVPNDEDYRVLVFGNKIALVMQRSRTDQSTHLNNTSQGARAKLVPTTTLPAQVQTAVRRAARLLDRQVAGVDIVRDKANDMWYCLEVNEGPQLASGSFTADKHAAFAAYLERKLGA